MPESTRQRLLRLRPEERRELLRRLGAGGAAPAEEPAPGADSDSGTLTATAPEYAARTPAPGAPRAGRRWPASPAQVSQWYLWNLAPTSDAYHVPHLFDLHGPVDAGALEEALRGVLTQHEGLRVSFEQRAGRVWQRLSAVPAEVVGYVEADGHAAARRALLAAAREPFDLRTGPLYRFSLCRYGRERHLLLLCFHHSVIDDQSARVLQRDLSARYTRATGGPVPPPAEGPRPVEPPSVDSGARAAGLRYWVETLRDGNPTIAPPDHLSPSATHPRSRAVVPLPAPTVPAVRRLAASSGTTTYVVLLALSWLFLARLTGRRDITLGSPVSLRDGGRDMDTVGFLLNSLALRGAVRPEETPRDLVRRAHRVFANAMAHRDTPLDDVTRAVAEATGRPGEPLFRTLLAYLRSDSDTDEAALRLPGVTVRLNPVNGEHTAFDLGITVLDGGERITVLLDYAADLYRDASVRNWGTAWRMIAEAAGRPDLPLAPLLHESRPPGRPDIGADPFCPVPHDTGTDGWAASTGTAPAVVADGHTVSRETLDRAAAALAGRLARRGVGAGSPVVLLLPPGAAAVAAAYAVWRRGATVVGVGDGDGPTDAAVTVVPTGHATGPGQLAVEPDPADWRGEPAAPVPAAEAACAWHAPLTEGPDRVAFADLARYQARLTRRYRALTDVSGHAPRVALTTPPGDPTFVVQALAPLAGAVLTVGDPDRAVPEDTDVLHCSTDQLDAFAATLGDRSAPRLVLTAGRPPAQRVRQRMARCGSTLVHTAPWPGPWGDPAGDDPAPEPWPLLGVEGRPVPAGTPGELAPAASPSGRSESPAATAVRYPPDPWSPRPGGRLFRSGHHARTAPDGQFDGLCWLPPGTPSAVCRVEAVLRELPGVAQVVAVPAPPGDIAAPLTVFLVADPGSVPRERGLREALPAGVPPRGGIRFITLPRLPLTGAGAPDRAALARLAVAVRRRGPATHRP